MNRDEKLTRVVGLPPARVHLDHRRALMPTEPAGGGWIGINDARVTFALINWYAIAARAGPGAQSRGLVVRAVLAAEKPDTAAKALDALPLRSINPFRLIGVFPAERVVLEWRWNLASLFRVDHAWSTQTWISSGFDEPGAQRVRTRVFTEAQQDESSGSLAWLRRLHQSHAPEPGPYSHCMHRSDAATVSYTEVAVSRSGATMRYCPGAPCCTELMPAQRLR